MLTEHKIETLRMWIEECAPGKMVFFGGAGVSTESGIPDFRSPKGLYNQPYKYPYPPEHMISRSFFDAHPSEFFEFYFDRMIASSAKPNKAHLKLAELEKRGTLKAVVTQNIDGLHQAAGSVNVLELHGSVLRNYCMRCGKPFSLEEITAAHEAAQDGVPRCSCGGIVKPDVVLYEEPLNDDVMVNSLNAVREADLLVIAGTSLTVYPAAGLPDYFNGHHLAIVNMSPTPRDEDADMYIEAPIGEVLGY